MQLRAILVEVFNAHPAAGAAFLEKTRASEAARPVLDTQLRDYLLAIREDLDPTFLFERVIGLPDPWQQELLRAEEEFILVLATRQVGKSTGIACLVWHLLAQGAFVILIAPSERQSKELFRKVLDFRAKNRLRPPGAAVDPDRARADQRRAADLRAQHERHHPRLLGG